MKLKHYAVLFHPMVLNKTIGQKFNGINKKGLLFHGRFSWSWLCLSFFRTLSFCVTLVPMVCMYTYGMYTYGMYTYDMYTYGMYTYGEFFE